MKTQPSVNYFWAWKWSLSVFVLAASTGALMRYGLAYGFPFGLQFANLRHAHSHLMYFSWVTPVLIAMIALYLPKVSDRELSRRFFRPITLSLILGVAAYVPFFLWGYSPVPASGLPMPPAVIGAGANIIGWYYFAWVYWQETRGIPRNFVLRMWDTSIIFMILATFGTWFLPVLTVLNIENRFLSVMLTHIFLDLFSEGWFILAL
ncbi:MAG TPA: hypothetical protein ENJ56_00325, partial [Anaerolineae bacterium]|nr:hypothetical protein [Anaerolineae bacterium]